MRYTQWAIVSTVDVYSRMFWKFDLVFIFHWYFKNGLILFIQLKIPFML